MDHRVPQAVDLTRGPLMSQHVPRRGRAGRAEVEVDGEPLAGPVIVDPEMWAKIVLNLSNALKFTVDGVDRGSTCVLRGPAGPPPGTGAGR
jgi:hypothetical protein